MELENIYETSSDLHIRATRIYVHEEIAYCDPEFNHKMSVSDLINTYNMGTAMIVDGESLYKPFEMNVSELGDVTIAYIKQDTSGDTPVSTLANVCAIAEKPVVNLLPLKNGSTEEWESVTVSIADNIIKLDGAPITSMWFPDSTFFLTENPFTVEPGNYKFEVIPVANVGDQQLNIKLSETIDDTATNHVSIDMAANRSGYSTEFETTTGELNLEFTVTSIPQYSDYQFKILLTKVA